MWPAPRRLRSVSGPVVDCKLARTNLTKLLGRRALGTADTVEVEDRTCLSMQDGQAQLMTMQEQVAEITMMKTQMATMQAEAKEQTAELAAMRTEAKEQTALLRQLLDKQ